MKKLLALVLALAMMLCMGTALATGDVEPSAAPTEPTTFASFKKTYVGADGELVAAGYVPGETLEFDVTLTEVDSEVSAFTAADAPVITVGNNNTFTVDSAEETISINLPEGYNKVGKATYTIKEATSNNTQGVTYSEDEITVTVLYEYVLDANQVPTDEVEATVYLTGNKLDELVNTYEAGKLVITKEIEGNVANKADEFEVTVLFSSEKPVASDIIVTENSSSDIAVEFVKDGDVYTDEVKFEVTNGTSVTFDNLPKGVTATISEETVGSISGKTYEQSNFTKSVEITADDQVTTVAIVNTLDTTVATGINMDSMPYIVLMGLVVLAGVALILKKRTVND